MNKIFIILFFIIGCTTPIKQTTNYTSPNSVTKKELRENKDTTVSVSVRDIVMKNKDTTLWLLKNIRLVQEYRYPPDSSFLYLSLVPRVSHGTTEDLIPPYTITGTKTGRAYHFIDRYHLVHSKDTFDIRDSLFWQIQ